MTIGAEGNVKWVDGLRGIASFSVVITHIARAFDGALFSPADAENAPARFGQLPMVRVLLHGRLGVAIFAFVTGYVCALKPIRLSRQNNQESAFMSMGKSALRRIPRLILPTSLSTIIIWFLAQFGIFNVAKHCNSIWLRDTAPNPTPYLGNATYSLARNLITTWTHGANIYEPNQWTLLPLLHCSMWIYAFMLGSAHMKPKWRMFSSLTLFFFFWCCSDTAFGMPTFFGAFLSDLQNHPSANEFINRNRMLGRVLSTIFFLLSFYFGSLPEANIHFKPWSQNMAIFYDKITPDGAELHRFSSCVGLVFLALSLHFAPGLRDLLSNRFFLWLGRMSFAVYLLHGFLMRTILAWLLYGPFTPADVTNADGNVIPGTLEYPGHGWLAVVLVFWFPLNYVAAFFWTSYIDPWAARVTEKIVGVMNVPKEKPRLPA